MKQTRSILELMSLEELMIKNANTFSAQTKKWSRQKNGSMIKKLVQFSAQTRKKHE